MRDQLLSALRRHRLIHPGDRIAVAVSGGADSVALLRALLDLRNEVGIVVSVAHFNHKIRGADADADEAFVRELATRFDLPFHRAEANVPALAREQHLSLEAAARRARYEFFQALVDGGQVTKIATAHTRDDQAETVLLRLIRGAGTRGLAGIHRTLQRGAIIRPMLDISRAEVEAYLRHLGQDWREDATNRDPTFARNRVRHELLPLLRRDYNPAIDQVLADTAEIARAEEEYWDRRERDALSELAGLVDCSPTEPVRAPVDFLNRQPLGLRRRLVRVLAANAGLSLDFHHVEQVLSLLETGKSAPLPQGAKAVISGRELRIEAQCLKEGAVSPYDQELRVPGEVRIREIGRAFRASVLDAAAKSAGYNDCQLDPAQLAPSLRIRNWRPGDRYWPAHTKSPRKVKELLQEHHIVQPRKAAWPVVESEGQIVWIPGFAPAANFLARSDTGPVVVIEEVSLG